MMKYERLGRDDQLKVGDVWGHPDRGFKPHNHAPNYVPGMAEDPEGDWYYRPVVIVDPEAAAHDVISDGAEEPKLE